MDSYLVLAEVVKEILQHVCKKTDLETPHLVLVLLFLTTCIASYLNPMSTLFIFQYALKVYLVHRLNHSTLLGLGKIMESTAVLLMRCSSFSHLKPKRESNVVKLTNSLGESPTVMTRDKHTRS